MRSYFIAIGPNLPIRSMILLPTSISRSLILFLNAARSIFSLPREAILPFCRCGRWPLVYERSRSEASSRDRRQRRNSVWLLHEGAQTAKITQRDQRELCIAMMALGQRCKHPPEGWTLRERPNRLIKLLFRRTIRDYGNLTDAEVKFPLLDWVSQGVPWWMLIPLSWIAMRLSRDATMRCGGR